MKSKKKKSNNASSAAAARLDSDDEMNDQWSVYSDDNSVASFNVDEQDLAGDVLSVDTASSQLQDAMDLLDNSRTTKDRVNALSKIIRTLQRQMLSEFIASNILTLTELGLKSLKKDASEAIYAGQLLVLLFVHVGNEQMEQYSQGIRDGLEVASRNSAHSMAIRGHFLKYLALCSYFSSNLDQDERLLASLEAFILGTMKKDILPLVIASLESWSILAVQFKDSRILKDEEKMLFRLLHVFTEFQENRDLRLAAGRVLCVIYNSKITIRDSGDIHVKKFQKHDDLYDLLQQLSNQGNKVIGKKDKKAYKSSLRDALCFMEFEQPDFEGIIRFQDEAIEIDSLEKQVIYDCFRELLSAGMSTHLSQNAHIRDFFDLGPPTLGDLRLNRKQIKDQQKMVYAESHKFTKQHRQKQRGKRTNNTVDSAE